MIETKIAHQWIGAANNEAMQRVQRWLAEGRTLSWLPIWSQANFPDIPRELLYFADQCTTRHVWRIKTVEDFLQIPEGITGWLLPHDEQDTDIGVGLWEDTLHFLRAVDKRNGAPQTLRSGKVWETVESSDDPDDVAQK